MEADTARALDAVPQLQEKLEFLRQRLGVPDLASALDRSLEIANYVAETIDSPDRKLLVEEDGKFTELTGIG